MQDVCDWLVREGFGMYAVAFQSNDIDGCALSRLGKDDLLDVGVRSVGHRLAILHAITSLRNSGDNVTVFATA